MEDHKQPRTAPATEKDEKILDLTEDMALADQAGHKIYDLSDGVAITEEHQPTEPPSSSPAPMTESEMEQSAAAAVDASKIQDSDSEPLNLKPESEMPPDESAEILDTPENSETAEAPVSIEEEVSAAFDAFQSVPSPEKKTEDEKNDQLFDKLSGMTQMVDDAVRIRNEDDASQQNRSSSPSSPPSIDDVTLSSDAAELEAAISADDEDDEIIELTDIVDPSEVMAGQEATSLNDDVIDLVDIVDPAELGFEAREEGGTGIIGETPDPNESEPETSTPKDQESNSKPWDASMQAEEELALSDLEGLDMNEETEKGFDLSDQSPIDGNDTLLGNEILMEKALSGTDDQDEGVEGDQEEDVILLTDILKKEDGAKVISLADKEADEKMAKESVSMGDMVSDGKSNRQIEAAVEYLLKTKYADTIRMMVSEAVEKAVAREVENMRRGLSDQDDS